MMKDIIYLRAWIKCNTVSNRKAMKAINRIVMCYNKLSIELNNSKKMKQYVSDNIKKSDTKRLTRR